jgi:hypothetical protein
MEVSNPDCRVEPTDGLQLYPIKAIMGGLDKNIRVMYLSGVRVLHIWITPGLILAIRDMRHDT